MSQEIGDHCETFPVEEKNLLGELINYFDSTDYDQQLQLANPTLINTNFGASTESEDEGCDKLEYNFSSTEHEALDGKQTIEDAQADSCEEGKTIVFTSYQLACDGGTKNNWYPSIYFHNL